MSNKERPWEGRVAFITGAVTGIGLGVAQAFADAGMRLALSYRNEEDKARTAEWFAQKGYEKPLFVKLDVTDRAAFAEAAQKVADHFGEVHVLVNNAGVSVFGPTDEATYDDYDWIMGVNFGGVVNGLVSFLPKIKASSGRRHVVNIIPAWAAGGHLHGEQIRCARAYRMPALQSCSAWDRLFALLSRAYAYQCLGFFQQAPGEFREYRFP